MSAATSTAPARALEIARDIVTRGWRPFPVDHPSLPVCAGTGQRCRRNRDKLGDCPQEKRGKHPVGGWGTQTASEPTDRMLLLWFSGEARNVGLACGPSGLLVLDEDKLGALEALAAQLGQTLPITYRVRTGRGWHWYFEDPENEFGNTAGALVDHGIDVRGGKGSGGYVLAAGSTHWTGHVYEAEDPFVAPASLPEWIKDLLRSRPTKEVESRIKSAGAGAGRADGEWDDLPRYGTEEALRAQFERHVTAVHALAVPDDKKPNGGEFRHALYLAALDGWRLVDCGLLDKHTMLRRMRDAVRTVWRADPDDDDRAIVYDEAREKASVSRWIVVVDAEDEVEVDAYRLALAEAKRKERIRRQAKAELDAEDRPPDPGPSFISLAHLLVEPDDAETYRIGQLWPSGGKVLLSAPQKSGKTTLVGNLVRSLADGTRFLSREVGPHEFKVAAAGFETTPLDGRRIALFDFEMTRRKLRGWLRDQRIVNSDLVHVEFMRGRVWDVRDPKVRKVWAERLIELNVGVMLVDPIGPVLGSLNIDENENTPVTSFLFALDALAREANVDELFVSHHTGHGPERARGASAFLGWPDANWTIVRDEMTNARAFKAEGRDVWLPETTLTYDHSTRRLGLGQGDRASARSAGHAEIIAEIVQESPGESLRGLKKITPETEIGTKAQHTQDAVRAAEIAGLIHVHLGPNRSRLHFPDRCSATCDGHELPLADPP